MPFSEKEPRELFPTTANWISRIITNAAPPHAHSQIGTAISNVFVPKCNTSSTPFNSNREQARIASGMDGKFVASSTLSVQ
jgi:hypothetical protein